MTQTDKARFVVEFDTAAAEAALRNLHATAAGGGGGGGGRQGGSRVNREGGGAPQGGSAFGRTQAPTAGSGMGMAGLAATVVMFKESLREIVGAASAYTDALNREGMDKLGIRERSGEVRAAAMTAQQMKSMYGISGHKVSPERRERDFQALNKFNLMEVKSDLAVERTTDPHIMNQSDVFFAALLGMGAAKGVQKWLSGQEGR